MVGRRMKFRDLLEAVEKVKWETTDKGAYAYTIHKNKEFRTPDLKPRDFADKKKKALLGHTVYKNQ